MTVLTSLTLDSGPEANMAESYLANGNINTVAPSPFPLHLVEPLNEAYFLHLLATDPDKVIPPGKSLLSMMTGSRNAPHSFENDLRAQAETLIRDRVEKAIHNAFWTEV